MSNEARIAEFYRTYLGREPDPGGLADYTRQANDGRELSSIKQSIATSEEARNNVRRAQNTRNQAAASAAAAQAYANQISGLQSQLKSYQTTISGLQNQYNTALGQIQTWQGKAGEYQKQASDFEERFNKRTEEFEAARDEAARYREQAVGQQLRALRSGAVAGGAGSSSGPSGDLTSGRTGYSSADDKAVEIEKNIKAESGALDRKGNIVELIRRNTSPSASSNQAQSRAVAQAGSGSYYASRFG